MLFNALAIIGLVQSIFMILQFYDIWVLVQPRLPLHEPLELLGGWVKVAVNGYHHKTDQSMLCMGLTSNANMASSLLGLSFPAFLRRKWWWGIPLILTCLYLSNSLGGLLAVVGALIVFGFVKIENVYARVGIATSLVLGFVGYVCVFESLDSLTSGSGRLEMFKRCFQYLIAHRPFVGYGNGMFKFLYSPAMTALGLNNMQTNYVHNDLIQVWIEQGLIGFVCILGYGISIWKHALKHKLVLPLLGITIAAINCNVNFLFHTSVCVMALVYGALIERHSANVSGNSPYTGGSSHTS